MLEDLAPSDRIELRLSGSGGQGVLLAATILAEAATTLGRHVVQTQSYGPAARGGASKAEVIVSSDEIDYPEVHEPDVSLCLSREAFDAFAWDTRPGGLLLYDSSLIEANAAEVDHVCRGIPFATLAADRLSSKVVANIIAVGALAASTGLLPLEAVEEAVLRRVPPRYRELNATAFRLGVELGTETPAGGSGEWPGTTQIVTAGGSEQ